MEKAVTLIYKIFEFYGQRNNTVSKGILLHGTKPAEISSTAKGPPSMAEVIPGHRTRSMPWVPQSMIHKKIYNGFEFSIQSN